MACRSLVTCRRVQNILMPLPGLNQPTALPSGCANIKFNDKGPQKVRPIRLAAEMDALYGKACLSVAFRAAVLSGQNVRSCA
jgi:hypothetical protein